LYKNIIASSALSKNAPFKIVHYRFHNSSALVPILGQSDSVKALAHYVFSIHVNILILFTCTYLEWHASFRL